MNATLQELLIQNFSDEEMDDDVKEEDEEESEDEDEEESEDEDEII